MATDIQIIECYKDLAIAVTVQSCKDYYGKLVRVPTYASSNRSWFLNSIVTLKEYILYDSWGAKMGADMEFVVNELERKARTGERMSWKRMIDTHNNRYTKGRRTR